ncbi:MAG TPA: YggS family pyridoxal phosphate-dependent enzyme [Chitinophagaceae bacterium]|nr:YggS family pyridoxal phosphate-dependent enzyme [Chitinophagaceae bacterium]
MPVNIDAYNKIIAELNQNDVTLVAVSKTKPVHDILELYNSGQKDFGENYVQELTEKAGQLPKDIHWHFIGHLQTNKVKYIAPFISLIQSADSRKLLAEINKQAIINNRTIDCLLQVHIAAEETKFGFDEKELHDIFDAGLIDFKNIRIRGLMGMASFTDDMNIVRNEFKSLRFLYEKYKSLDFDNCRFSVLSMGMSADYKTAIEEGSNMVRIGSLLFGKRH